jgi:nucleotide-binding universal stress UspA family protein
MGGYTLVVAGTDGSETSFRAVERAAELVRADRRPRRPHHMSTP